MGSQGLSCLGAERHWQWGAQSYAVDTVNLAPACRARQTVTYQPTSDVYTSIWMARPATRPQTALPNRQWPHTPHAHQAHAGSSLLRVCGVGLQGADEEGDFLVGDGGVDLLVLDQGAIDSVRRGACGWLQFDDGCGLVGGEFGEFGVCRPLDDPECCRGREGRGGGAVGGPWGEVGVGWRRQLPGRRRARRGGGWRRQRHGGRRARRCRGWRHRWRGRQRRRRGEWWARRCGRWWDRRCGWRRRGERGAGRVGIAGKAVAVIVLADHAGESGLVAAGATDGHHRLRQGEGGRQQAWPACQGGVMRVC